MKYVRFLAFAALFLASPALAQWQVQNYGVPVGQGSGKTGFKVIAPEATLGRPIVGKGIAVDPGYGQAANAGIAPGAANTVKGSLNGTTTVDIVQPNCNGAAQAIQWTAGVGPGCGTISTATGFGEPVNAGFSSSVVGGALTINLTTASGATPSAGSPVVVPFRSTTLATGTVTTVQITSATSITIPAGATLGTSNSTPFRIWIFVNYNSGAPQLGVATCSNATSVLPCTSWEYALKTTTTISAGATAAGTLYAPAGVALDSVRIVGFCEYASGLATAGTYASACTTLQAIGPGIKKPGDTVQVITSSTSTTLTINSAATTATALTGTITPSSSANLVKVQSFGMVASGSSNGNGVSFRLYRNTGATAIGNVSGANAYGTTGGTIYSAGTLTNFALDAPGSSSSVQYGLYATGSGIGTWTFLGAAQGIPASTGFLTLEEIMG